MLKVYEPERLDAFSVSKTVKGLLKEGQNDLECQNHCEITHILEEEMVAQEESSDDVSLLAIESRAFWS
jgi:hypothetical protein